MVSGWPAYLTRHGDCLLLGGEGGGRLEADVLLAQLVLHVALREVRVAGHDEAEHEQKGGQGQAAGTEEEIEGSTFHRVSSLLFAIPLIVVSTMDVPRGDEVEAKVPGTCGSIE